MYLSVKEETIEKEMENRKVYTVNKEDVLTYLTAEEYAVWVGLLDKINVRKEANLFLTQAEKENKKIE